MRVVLVGLAICCACYSSNPAAGADCSTDGTCPSGLVCDPRSNKCVATIVDGGIGSDAPTACTTNAMCSGTSPVCDTQDGLCRGCIADKECASGVCSESTGSCIAADASLYVTQSGVDNNTCDQTDPCATVSHALTLVTDTINTIAVGDGTYTDSFIIDGPAQVLISGSGGIGGGSTGPSPSATFVFTAGGGQYDHVIEVRSGSVTVEGVTFTEAKAEDVRIQGGATLELFHVEVASSVTGGIDCAANSTIHLIQSSVHSNGQSEPAVMVAGGSAIIERSLITTNTGGGIRISGGASYSVTNTFITLNGSLTANAPAVDLQDTSPPATAVFDFNTVAENNTGPDPSVYAGAQCATSTPLTNSIFANNNVSGECVGSYTLYDEGTLRGTHNLTGDPGFVGGTNFHLAAGSPAIDSADPTSTNAIDYDGDARPNGSASDIGADEYVP